MNHLLFHNIISYYYLIIFHYHNNSNVNNLIKYIEEIEGNSSNIYKVIYGKDNNEGISSSNK